MTKTSLTIVAALLLSGCAPIDDAINDAVNGALSGDVTADTMMLKERVVIINNVNRTACVTIKNGLISNDFENPEVLVTELGVTCRTYHKETGSITDPDAVCYEEDLVDWLEHESNGNITNLEEAQGDKACVIGADF